LSAADVALVPLALRAHGRRGGLAACACWPPMLVNVSPATGAVGPRPEVYLWSSEFAGTVTPKGPARRPALPAARAALDGASADGASADGASADGGRALSVAIVTDGACSLPAQMARECGVTVVPMWVTIGGRQYRDSELSMEDLIGETVDGVSTFGPAPGELARAVEVADTGDGPSS